MEELTEKAANHFRDILAHAIQHQAPAKALLIFDRQDPLTILLADAFRQACPEADAVDFDSVDPAEIRQRIYALQPGDLVVLLQTSNFRLNEFRMRIELFSRGLKTIEVGHLNRIPSEQYATYIAAFAYDPSDLRPLGHELKRRLDQCQEVRVLCRSTELVYQGGMEPAKLNIGDYSGMKNIGGTFPIGEVFTEPKDLILVNGELMIFAFAEMDHKVREFAPFPIRIEKGVVVSAEGAPASFHQILDMIRGQEQVLVREFGLGLNRAVGKGRLVSDITAFERMRGLHLSLGSKHAIYKKPGLSPKKMRYHIDVFADITEITIDGRAIYRDGDFSVV